MKLALSVLLSDKVAVVVAGEIIFLAEAEAVAPVAGRDTNKHRLILIIPFIL
jgi:hypothetical protein